MRASGIIDFLKKDIWRVRRKALPAKKSALIRALRVVVLSIRGFIEDDCSLRASALTFYSLLSIVPVVAMIFGVAKGFGLQAALEKAILENLRGQEDVAFRIIEFSQAMLENVRGGAVAGVGLVFLFYTVIKILSNIEQAFNHIWGVQKSRSMGRKVSDYLAAMIICPALFIFSSGMIVYVSGGVKTIVERVSLLGPIAPVIFFLLGFLPYAAIWILFVFLYLFMPNIKVNAGSGIIAGLIAGTMFNMFQWGYVNFQIGVTRYNAVYGSFAALPLFIVWLQLGWLIVLFGSEISFAYQNADTYEFEHESLSVSHAFKRLLSLRIIHLIIHRFADGDSCTAEQISDELDIPVRLTQRILFELVSAGLLSEIAGERRIAYQPARDTQDLTVKMVVDALETRGGDDIPVIRSEELHKIEERLAEFDECIRRSPANQPLKQI